MIVAGFGFRAQATVASLQDALERANGDGTSRVATLDKKADTAVFQEFSQVSGIEVQCISDVLARKQQTVTRSKASLAAYGIASVAEACALAAAGPGATLLQPRSISGDGMATCALATGKGT